MDQPGELITIKAIGYVRSRFDSYTPSDEMRAHSSEIVVHPGFVGGLMGLESGGQILTLFLLHRAMAVGYELQLHPGHNPNNPIRGVFSTRSQYRPNFIAATVARIQSIRHDGATGEAVLTVTELDAQDGSPVIDIKPYRASLDAPPP